MSGARPNMPPVALPRFPRSCERIWRGGGRLHERGYPTRGVDFIIPGDLAGEGFGIRDPQTGACHMTGNQAQKWGPRYMTPAVNSVADNYDGYASLRGAT